jgi:hypothetical protein
MKFQKAKANNWVEVATQNILTELRGRSGIGNALDECDEEVMQEIRNSIAELIRKANREAVNDANTTFP